ncbi:hypothetical protein ACLRDC_09065 [Gluconacetobacter sacchari]|uniref:hypothetical protein n=1 Tax=Gluconacetobacter sacchari TaxID=92759 RepID=UPI0039B55561
MIGFPGFDTQFFGRVIVDQSLFGNADGLAGRTHFQTICWMVNPLFSQILSCHRIVIGDKRRIISTKKGGGPDDHPP